MTTLDMTDEVNTESAHATKAMVDITKDPGQIFNPGSLEFTLPGATSTTRSILLQKRDGRYLLAIWQQEQIWNRNTLQMLNPPDVNLSVVLTRNASWRRFQPNSASRASAIGATLTGQTYAVTSSERVTFVEITLLEWPPGTAERRPRGLGERPGGGVVGRKVRWVRVGFEDGDIELFENVDALYRVRSNCDAKPSASRLGWDEHEVTWTSGHHPVKRDDA